MGVWAAVQSTNFSPSCRGQAAEVACLVDLLIFGVQNTLRG